MTTITTLDELQALYGESHERSRRKELPRLIEPYRALIEASPFVVLASVGPDGLDCSPRGDAPGFVQVLDDQTLLLPDRPGNNRIDSLRNIVRDPRVGLLFLIPGSHTTIRMNGTAIVTADPELLASFEKAGKQPRSAVVVTVNEIYTQCGRAVLRAKLWDPERHVDPADIPTAGDILKERSEGAFDAETYDREWAGRAKKTMW